MPKPAFVSHAARLESFRLALLPVHREAAPAALCEALIAGGTDFLEMLLAQGLAPLWHQRLQVLGRLEALPAAMADALQQARIDAAARYLAQRTALARVDALFASAGIRHVVMKGAQVRECVYPDPALRPAADIDLLIAAEDRRRAAHALLDAGFSVNADPANVSHEAGFTAGAATLDLHWHLLRPGRTRTDMTAELLERRQRCNDIWGLSDADVLFVMLTHPAFTKYVSSPNMGLSQVADFLFWIGNRATDWPVVRQRLDHAGLKAAAWTLLRWYRMLAPAPASAPDAWADDLLPGRWRRSYLACWLAHDLPGRWLDRPWRIQLGFTLFMHDRMTDAGRAISGWLKSRLRQQQDVRRLLGDAAGRGASPNHGFPE